MFSAKDMNINKSFIEEVITEAKKTFATGSKNNADLKKRAEQDSDIRDKYHLAKPYASIKNEPFTGDASRIPGTNFIASAGPQNINQLNFLINDTIFHLNDPVYQIVAFGDCLAYSEGVHQDFHDYCLKQREFNCHQYQITVNRVSGDSSTTVSQHQIFPRGIVQSRLLIKNEKNTEKQLDVVLFELHDNCSIELSEKNSDDTKETLWQLFQKSQKERILVHCASGVGRTGHFILIMEILKHYEGIFNENNPVTAAQKIHKLLENMRRVRPALVYTEMQFIDAINNAHEIYQYGLKKNYILVEQPVVEIDKVSSISMFSNNKVSSSDKKKTYDEADENKIQCRCVMF